jgi:hypothetical protein
MEYEKVLDYLNASYAIEARDRLNLIQALSYPNFKHDSDRKKLINNLNKQADIFYNDNKKEKSIEEFASILAGGIVG